MIEAAAVLIALAVLADAVIVALGDVKYDRARVDRRFRRRS